jgi:hypothetical protein
MNKLQITKRDVKIFIFGMVTMLLLILLYEWDDFKAGLIGGYNDSVIEQEK